MNRLSPDEDDARYIRRLFLTLGVGALAAALYFTGDLLILAFGSILGAIVIHALAEIYEHRLRLSAKPALGAGIVTVLAIIVFLGWLFGVEFRTQVNVLVTRLPGIIAELGAQLSTSPVGAKVVDAVRAAFAGSRVAQDIGGLAQGAGQFVLNALLVLVGAIFFAVDPKIYERGFLLLMPPSKRAVMEDALLDTASTLRLWLRAQLIQMTTMGVLVGLGLWLVDVVPALGLAATKSLHHVLLTVAVFAVVRVVQTNFITPFVTSRVVAIPPAVTLFAILAIGAVFGLFGLFFSAAMLVVIYTLVRSLYLRDTLGEDIPRARHRTLFDSAGTPRD